MLAREFRRYHTEAFAAAKTRCPPRRRVCDANQRVTADSCDVAKDLLATAAMIANKTAIGNITMWASGTWTPSSMAIRGWADPPSALPACSVGTLPICGVDQRLKGPATGAQVH